MVVLATLHGSIRYTLHRGVCCTTFVAFEGYYWRGCELQRKYDRSSSWANTATSYCRYWPVRFRLLAVFASECVPSRHAAHKARGWMWKRDRVCIRPALLVAMQVSGAIMDHYTCHIRLHARLCAWMNIDDGMPALCSLRKLRTVFR
eukprot:TRINITY_DN5683_c0_g1_i1.p1 TRINITY_DN5683_c0_g1~~TRINITY_DN5683_c0_g1_i1.p1  ORF type:complete len:147 (-),score=3.42 TRINITY_DN5683_c0_g1_i1:49-489(-)